jgi:16S rRNA (cytidine1402-2'-O)-methyltransferase
MSKLILIPTPIGNLKDITLRAIEAFKSVDWILAEDTRVTRKLLNHLEIQKEVFSYHSHNEHKKLDFVIDKILASETVGLVSDAGTPGISDPGFLLIRSCIENNIEIECLPGAVALIPALVQSGFPCDKFVFEGFLPHKKGRVKRLEQLKEEERTIIFYESPYRVLKLIEQLRDIFGEERAISVSREITKMFEETVRGNTTEVLAYFQAKPVKGEFVVVVKGFDESA